MYVYVFVFVYVCVYICVCMYVCVCVYVCMYVYVCVCTCVYVCVCVNVLLSVSLYRGLPLHSEKKEGNVLFNDTLNTFYLLSICISSLVISYFTMLWTYKIYKKK